MLYAFGGAWRHEVELTERNFDTCSADALRERSNWVFRKVTRGSDGKEGTTVTMRDIPSFCRQTGTPKEAQLVPPYASAPTRNSYVLLLLYCSNDLLYTTKTPSISPHV